MPSDAEIRALASKNTAIVQGYLDDTVGWKIAKKTNDVLIECKKSICPGFEHGYLYRGQSEYSCPKETVFRYVDPTEGAGSLRMKWDKVVKNFQVFKRIDADIAILTSMTKSFANGSVSARDYIDVMLVKRTENSISSNGVSIETAEYPPKKDFIRGFNHPCGFFCLSIPGKPNSTKLVTLNQPDIKGTLSRSVIHSVLPVLLTDFFNDLRAFMKKEGQLPS